MTVLAHSSPPGDSQLDERGCGIAGWPATRLLAGPQRSLGPEPLELHSRRVGQFVPPASSEQAVELVGASGLLGRGGGEFPFAEKLRAAGAAHGPPLVVVNGSEGEPASRKDRELLELRPHLVLDGASWASAAIGAPQVVIYLEAGRCAAWQAMRSALRERRIERTSDPDFHFVAAPDRYVAGESSAVVSVLEGRGPLPRRRPIPVAASGVGGRPTVVANTETLAHLALIARFGPDWFRQAGSPRAPGSTLVTLAGEVVNPGLVVEVVEPIATHRILTSLAGLDGVPEAVLVGGYGGRWVDGPAIWDAPLDRAVFRAAGCGLGCGLLAVLPRRRCGLAVTHRILDYLAGESAGQCGSCLFGLPALVEGLGALIAGRSGRRGPDRLHAAAFELEGRGGCGHPDGAAGLLQSALEVFGADAHRHARRHPCGRDRDGGWFPVPSERRRRP
ncbi:MAG TPA: NADH-ubiquinone oxidoreductase-F iron-sulfur binding region domain-containing protein [Acidimicrobiales bacterium]|nr:NADH-ubiquinone oxidoreductase-F iron-sulfur binding region domain-containing protein [Acidimicrobiales bacterium]